MLQIDKVPVHYSAQQTDYLLHNSEHFFPPLNAICTLGNLIVTGITFYYSRGSGSSSIAFDNTARVASAKLPRQAIAFALSVATTAYALGIMVPMNRKMQAIAGEMEKAAQRGEEKSSEMQKKALDLKGLQNRWMTLNYGRALVMIGASLAGMSALLAH